MQNDTSISLPWIFFFKLKISCLTFVTATLCLFFFFSFMDPFFLQVCSVFILWIFSSVFVLWIISFGRAADSFKLPASACTCHCLSAVCTLRLPCVRIQHGTINHFKQQTKRETFFLLSFNIYSLSEISDKKKKKDKEEVGVNWWGGWGWIKQWNMKTKNEHINNKVINPILRSEVIIPYRQGPAGFSSKIQNKINPKGQKTSAYDDLQMYQMN